MKLGLEAPVDLAIGHILRRRRPQVGPALLEAVCELRVAVKRRGIVRVPVPGKAAAAIRAGANLAPDRAVGRRTCEEFLAERVGSSPISRSVPKARSRA
jgi:hypothetical protein